MDTAPDIDFGIFVGWAKRSVPTQPRLWQTYTFNKIKIRDNDQTNKRND